MRTTKLLILILIIPMLISSCLTGEEQTEQQVAFDLDKYFSEIKKEHPRLNEVFLISINDDARDTLYFDTYNIDSISHIISRFNFNRRERGSGFHVEKKTSENIICHEYIPKGESDISFMRVCKEKDLVVSLAGAKKKNSLLGNFVQSYQFDPESMFELNTFYVDKVQSDTVYTQNYLTWKSK